MDAVTCRLAECNEPDGLAFCSLYSRFYPKRCDLAYFRWQFFDTPFPSLLFTAVADRTEPIGFLGVHILPGNIRDTNVAWVIDMMVHPDFQRRGVLRSLVSYATNQVSAFNPIGMFVIANTAGRDALTLGQDWTKIVNLHSYTASTKAWAASYPTGSSFRVAPLCSPNKECPDMRTAPDCAGLFRIKRDPTYKDWRFTRNPRNRYNQLTFTGDAQSQGYLVLKTFRDPISKAICGDIVDLTWSGNDPHFVENLFCVALSHFSQLNVVRVFSWAQTSTVADQIATRLGFSVTPQERYFCGCVLNPEFEYLREAGRWFITPADSEVY
jgi:hypothetical protein